MNFTGQFNIYKNVNSLKTETDVNDISEEWISMC